MELYYTARAATAKRHDTTKGFSIFFSFRILRFICNRMKEEKMWMNSKEESSTSATTRRRDFRICSCLLWRSSDYLWFPKLTKLWLWNRESSKAENTQKRKKRKTRDCSCSRGVRWWERWWQWGRKGRKSRNSIHFHNEPNAATTALALCWFMRSTLVVLMMMIY